MHVGSFLEGIPYPLGLGKIELQGGEWVTGFTCCEAGLRAVGAEEISSYGGWAAYVAAKKEAVEQEGRGDEKRRKIIVEGAAGEGSRL